MEYPDFGQRASSSTDSLEPRVFKNKHPSRQHLWCSVSLTCCWVADGFVGMPSNAEQHVFFKGCMSLVIFTPSVEVINAAPHKKLLNLAQLDG